MGVSPVDQDGLLRLINFCRLPGPAVYDVRSDYHQQLVVFDLLAVGRRDLVKPRYASQARNSTQRASFVVSDLTGHDRWLAIQQRDAAFVLAVTNNGHAIDGLSRKR